MRAILWCNGRNPTIEMMEVFDKDIPLFGVDGGADKAKNAGYDVIEVLGDLDSVDSEEWNKKSTELPDPSNSDLAKSLAELASRGFNSIDIVGIDGGSPSHILGNWAALADAPGSLCIRMQHENGTTIRLHPDEGAAEFEAEIGTEFSVFALSKCERVTIGGAKWNLDSQPLDFSTHGLHNLTTETHLKIQADGIIAIIF